MTLPVTSHQSIIEPLSSTTTYGPPADFDSWLLWLDDTQVLVRRMARRWRIAWHREQLAELETSASDAGGAAPDGRCRAEGEREGRDSVRRTGGAA